VWIDQEVLGPFHFDSSLQLRLGDGFHSMVEKFLMAGKYLIGGPIGKQDAFAQ
jgi:hypothetical protein